jgi:hypothetical protein
MRKITFLSLLFAMALGLNLTATAKDSAVNVGFKDLYVGMNVSEIPNDVPSCDRSGTRYWCELNEINKDWMRLGSDSTAVYTSDVYARQLSYQTTTEGDIIEIEILEAMLTGSHDSNVLDTSSCFYKVATRGLIKRYGEPTKIKDAGVVWILGKRGTIYIESQFTLHRIVYRAWNYNELTTKIEASF